MFKTHGNLKISENIQQLECHLVKPVVFCSYLFEIYKNKKLLAKNQEHEMRGDKRLTGKFRNFRERCVSGGGSGENGEGEGKG